MTTNDITDITTDAFIPAHLDTTQVRHGSMFWKEIDGKREAFQVIEIHEETVNVIRLTPWVRPDGGFILDPNYREPAFEQFSKADALECITQGFYS